jgi:hypothetical protein
MKNGNSKSTPRREAAFDLFCRGLSLREVRQELKAADDGETPSLSTLKRWSNVGEWVARRSRIQSARREQQDQDRIIYGMDYIAELTSIRRKLLADAAQQNTHAAAQAVYALVALEKLLHDLIWKEKCAQLRKQREPGYMDLLEQLVSTQPVRTDPPPPLDYSALLDEALQQESLRDDADPEPE